MPQPPVSTDSPESFDADEIYRQLGIFVVCFQYLESELAEICWLLTEPPFAKGEREQLARLTYGKLVRETRKRITALLKRRNLDRPEFVTRAERVLNECRELGYLRNRIVHSAFVHLEAGGELRGIMRSNMRVQAAGESHDVEFLTRESFDAPLASLAQTAFSLGQLHIQLVHWTPTGSSDQP
jgi:hypothetical protein